MYRTGTITNDSHGWPLEGGGGTMYPDSIYAQHSTAQHNTAQVTQSSSLFARRTVATLVPSRSTALPQSKPCLAEHPIHSSEKHFPYASCAGISGSGRLFFVPIFPDFELILTYLTQNAKGFEPWQTI